MFTYTKISKYLSAKYYQDYKERLQKKKTFEKRQSFQTRKKATIWTWTIQEFVSRADWV